LAERSPIVINGPRSCAEPARSGWWDVEPAVRRVADGIPNREHRLRGLGNAQVPLCAAIAWKLLGGPMSTEFYVSESPNAKADLPPPEDKSINQSRSTAVQSSELLDGGGV
jgi:hypothetical protein